MARLVGSPIKDNSKQRGPDGEAEDLRRLKIDDQLEINRLHDRQIGALGEHHV